MVYDFKKQCESTERKFLLLLDKFADSVKTEEHEPFYETDQYKPPIDVDAAYHDIAEINESQLYSEANQYIEPTELESYQNFDATNGRNKSESVVILLDDESLDSVRRCESVAHRNANNSIGNFDTNNEAVANESTPLVIIDDDSIVDSEEQCEMVEFSAAVQSNEPHHNYDVKVKNKTVVLEDNISIVADKNESVACCPSRSNGSIDCNLLLNCGIYIEEPQLLTEMVAYPNAADRLNESAESVSRQTLDINVSNVTNVNSSSYKDMNQIKETKFDCRSSQECNISAHDTYESVPPSVEEIKTAIDPLKNIEIVAKPDANQSALVQCDICKRTFTALLYLTFHMKMHIRRMEMHQLSTWNIKTPDDGTKQYMCDICSKQYSSIYYIADHMRLHSGNLKKCHICDKRFITDGHLKTHLARHRRKTQTLAEWYTKKLKSTDSDGMPIRKLKCEICGKMYSNSYYIEKHMQLHLYGGDLKRCKICHKRFATDGGLKTHLTIHTNIRPFTCNVCGKTFRLTKGLTQHKMIHTDERPFECTECDAAFRQKVSLQQHFIAIHTTERPHACPVCDKRFKTKEHMTIHCRRRHIGEKPHSCKDCEKQFATAAELSVHITEHNGACKNEVCQRRTSGTVVRRTTAREKSFACAVCDKRFKSMAQRTVHYRQHTGERPFKCSVCNKRFTNSATLQMHTMIHTGERPHKCTLCEATFRVKYSLRQHMVIRHTTEKPYACTDCDKRFRTKEQMTVHYRQHTGERPFRCMFCDKRYTNPHGLWQHQQTHTRKDSK